MSNVKSIGIKVSGLSPLDTYNYTFLGFKKLLNTYYKKMSHLTFDLD